MLTGRASTDGYLSNLLHVLKSMDYQALYGRLFAPVVAQYGELDPETLTSVIGFTEGGPVSLATIASRGLHVTCELAANPEQVASVDGLKYELLSTGGLSESWCLNALTALGELSLSAALGDGHTVDLSPVLDEAPQQVRLSLFAEVDFEGVQYGLYEVVPL